MALVQGSEAWKEFRRTKLTASDACKLGTNAIKTRESMIREKLGYAGANLDGCEWLRTGHDMEPVAIDEYERRTGRAVVRSPPPFVHPQHSDLAASLDGYVEDGRVVVEVKSVKGTKFKTKPAPVHWRQVQFQLECFDGREGVLLYYYYDVGRLDIFEIDRDRKWWRDNLPTFLGFMEELRSREQERLAFNLADAWEQYDNNNAALADLKESLLLDGASSEASTDSIAFGADAGGGRPGADPSERGGEVDDAGTVRGEASDGEDVL